MRKVDYKQEYTLSVMKVAYGLSTVTEDIVNSFVESSKPERSKLLEQILTDAGRNSHLAEETLRNYGSNNGSKISFDF